MSVLKEPRYNNANNTLVPQDVDTHRLEMPPANTVQLSIVRPPRDAERAIVIPSVSILEPPLPFFPFLM